MVVTRQHKEEFVYTLLQTPPRRSRKSKPFHTELQIDMAQEDIEQVIEYVEPDVSVEGIDIQSDRKEVLGGSPSKNAILAKGRKKKKESEDTETDEFSRKFTAQQISEILQEIRVVRLSPPPSVPLCRILINEAVRLVSKGSKAMRDTLRNDGYVQEKESFILSLSGARGNCIPVTDNIKSSWDPLWVEENDRFEDELVSNLDWQDLSGRMFLCWDGNHRTDAWMQEIRERHQHVRSMHFSVHATFVEVDDQHETQLIAAMQRINQLNETGVVRIKLKDILYGVHRLTTSDLTTYTSHLSVEELRLSIDREKHVLGEEPWFPLTRYLLAKIMYQSTIEAEIEEAANLMEEPLLKEDRVAKAEKEVRRKWQNKFQKYLAIVNPVLESDWLKNVTSRDLDNKKIALTLEKLFALSKSTVSNQQRNKWLNIMASGTAMIDTYGLPNNDKQFREWVKEETWMEHMLKKATQQMESVCLASEIAISHNDDDLDSWFREFWLQHRSNLFQVIEKKMSYTTPPEEAFDVHKVSMRVTYRYFKYALARKYILKVSTVLKSWTVTSGESCMYLGPGQLDREPPMKKWEVENCPWWLDFKQGCMPEEEKQIWAARYKTDSKDEKTASATSMKTVDSDGTRDVDTRNVKRKRRHIQLSDESDPVQTPTMHKFHSETLQDTQEISSQMPLNIDMEAGRVYKNVALKLLTEDVRTVSATLTSKNVDTPFKVIREFGKSVKISSKRCSRNGEARDWGVDLLLIDLPNNQYPTIGHPHIPDWNQCDSQLIDDCFSIGNLCLDDKGYLVCMCTMDMFKSVEVIAKKRNMEQRRTYMLINDVPFSYGKDMLGFIDTSSLCVMLYGRIGYQGNLVHPMAFMEGKLDHMSSILKHESKQSEKLISDGSGGCRYNLQKSIAFMQFLLHSFCVPNGFVLDLFAGIGSMMEAAAIWGANYFGIEKDKTLCQIVMELQGCNRPRSLGFTSPKKNIEDEDDEEVATADLVEPED